MDFSFFKKAKQDNYWPLLPPNEIGSYFLTNVAGKDIWADYTNYTDRMIASCEQYFGDINGVDTSTIQKGGEVGETVLINVNYYRFLLQHVLSIVAGDDIAFNVEGKNNDVKTRLQVMLASGLLEGYVRDLKLDELFPAGLEMAIVMSEAFFITGWDTRAFDAAGNKVGDVFVKVRHFFDVRYDYTDPSRKFRWFAFRDWINKYELAAQYPEKYDAIMNAQPNLDDYAAYRMTYGSNLGQTDLVGVWTVRHAHTDAVPKGLEFRLIGDGNNDTVLEYGPLPYKSVNCFRVSHSKQFFDNMCYTPAFDALSLIEASNSLESTILSNQLALGLQKVWTQLGDDITPVEVSTGMINLQSQVKPEALNLVQTASELFVNRDNLRQLAATILGLNDSIMGTESTRFSGAAIGQLSQRATQFLSSLHRSYKTCQEEVLNSIIQILQIFAEEERVGRLVGVQQSYAVKEFAAKDLSDIDRVYVVQTNPAMRTPEARQQMVQQMAAQGLISDKNEFMELFATGRISDKATPAITQANLSLSENERLLTGQMVMAIITDNHTLHIQDHRTLLDIPEVRYNPELFQRISQHIMEHNDLYTQATVMAPNILMATNQSPAIMAQQQAAASRQGPDPSAAPSPEGQQGDQAVQDNMEQNNALPPAPPGVG